ncbi:DUF3742 family protein [Xanthomonas citri]|uniref:DUF3742 family protein n=1 Tax=Xanthomonas citri TaxID=346 RepID=UPI0009B990A7|nr:DUF3742 family protein [Xanthomonas citri]ATS87140.1 DUF3742 family protein [Xanthomonas citri pv. phaseoli var. fuscans]QWN04593.1 DUF3742 domain-containing protein [Xanthomonas citri pv. fuscans]
MKTKPQSSNPEKLGRWLGKAWRSYVQVERRLTILLSSKGVPLGLAAVLFWFVKAAAVAVLLYTAFWLTLLLAFAVLLARGLAGRAYGPDDSLEPREEMRHGEAGFGLYSSEGHRLDPHDPNSPYDN